MRETVKRNRTESGILPKSGAVVAGGLACSYVAANVATYIGLMVGNSVSPSRSTESLLLQGPILFEAPMFLSAIIIGGPATVCALPVAVAGVAGVAGAGAVYGLIRRFSS